LSPSAARIVNNSDNLHPGWRATPGPNEFPAQPSEY
jgi:hypothetical protein